jgi:hypothetical protein
MASTDALPLPVKATAFRMPVGPFFKTDGTLITNWTAADSEISEDGANFTDCTNEATEIQTSGVGFLDLTSGETDCDSFWIKTTISNTDAVPFVAYFATQRAGAYLRSDVRENAGTAITSAAGVQEVKVASMAAAAIASIWDALVAGITTANSIGKRIIDNLTGDIYARLGAPAGASVSADVAAVKSDTAAILVDTGTTLDAAIAALPTAVENADALLNRDMSAVSDTEARSPLNALRFLRNKWAVAAGTLTVRKEDDATSAWTAAISSDASADPITGSDPA